MILAYIYIILVYNTDTNNIIFSYKIIYSITSHQNNPLSYIYIDIYPVYAYGHTINIYIYNQILKKMNGIPQILQKLDEFSTENPWFWDVLGSPALERPHRGRRGRALPKAHGSSSGGAGASPCGARTAMASSRCGAGGLDFLFRKKREK